MRTPDYFLDIGKGTNQITLLTVATDTITILKRNEVLRLPETLPVGSFIVGENSHFGVPRSKKSRSQYYYARELGPWYRAFNANNILFKLAPEKLTPRANALTKVFKDKGPEGDANDVRGWAMLLKLHPEICLKNPNLEIDQEGKVVSPVRLEGWMYRQETGWILNGCRSHDEPYTNPDDMILAFLNDNIIEIWHELSDETKFMLDWPTTLEQRSKCKNKKNPCGWIKKKKLDLTIVNNMKALYTLAAMFLDSEKDTNGNIVLRTRKDNPHCADQQPGIDFLMTHVVCNTAFHLKGGVARSNIYYWWMRNRIKRAMAVHFFQTDQPTKKQVSAMGCKKRGGNFASEGGKTITLMDGSTKRYKGREFMPETIFTDNEEKMFLVFRTQGRKAIQEILRLFKIKIKKWVDTRQNLVAHLV